MFWIERIIVFVILFSQTLENQNVNNFGPYNMVWEHIGTCKGPKQGDCGKVHLENTQNMSDVIFVLDFPKDCPVTKAKVTIGSNQNNSTKKLWNYSLDSPCQHFVLGPILTQSFNLTANNCKINKGYYHVHVNMDERSTTFLGSSFFYGHYKFKIIAHNRANNFFCVETVISVEKKN